MTKPSCDTGGECDEEASWEAELWLEGPRALFYNACDTHIAEIIDSALESPATNQLILNRLTLDYLAFHQSHQGASNA